MQISSPFQRPEFSLASLAPMISCNAVKAAAEFDLCSLPTSSQKAPGIKRRYFHCVTTFFRFLLVIVPVLFF